VKGELWGTPSSQLLGSTPTAEPAMQALPFTTQSTNPNTQGQAGWGFEQPGLVEGVPAHGRGVVTR